MDFFLLDTNLFREATKSPGHRLMARLIPELDKHGFKFGDAGSTAIRISPFALLEALGIVAKMPPARSFTVGKKDPKLVYKEIFDYAFDHFMRLPQLQNGYLQQKHDDQVRYVNDLARPFFAECVTDVLSRIEDRTELFATFLATDYFLKYRFTDEDFLKMMQFLITFFFIDLPEYSPASRYRMSVRVFNYIEPQLVGVPGHAEEVRANRLKNKEDFLDTDIVQEITYGFPLGGDRHRVIALTFDDAGTLLRRARHHRQVGLTVSTRYQSDPAMAKIAKSFMDHPGGVIVQADKTGAILRIVDLRDVFAQFG